MGNHLPLKSYWRFAVHITYHFGTILMCMVYSFDPYFSWSKSATHKLGLIMVYMGVDLNLRIMF